MRSFLVGITALALAAVGCKKETPQVVYQAVPVEQRDIVVSAQAAGAIQPDTTVEVKSKASGEILQLFAETGQLVKRGAQLVRVGVRREDLRHRGGRRLPATCRPRPRRFRLT